MKIELTAEETKFLYAMLSGATVQGADAMRTLLTILGKLTPALTPVPPEGQE